MGRNGFALGPKILEDDGSHHNAQDDSNQTVSDLVEICIRREALEDAHEKGEGDLQTRISDPLTACRDPSSQGSSCCGQE